MQDEYVAEQSMDSDGGVPETIASREYLTFEIGAEEYAVAIELVKEIRAWEPVTRIPHAASFECGLINIRGAIVPILDMRKRLGLEAHTYDRHTIVILFCLQDSRGQERTAGAVVDALSDVARIPDARVQPPPQLTRRRSLEFAAGVVEYESRMIVILDVAKALAFAAPAAETLPIAEQTS